MMPLYIHGTMDGKIDMILTLKTALKVFGFVSSKMLAGTLKITL